MYRVGEKKVYRKAKSENNVLRIKYVSERNRVVEYKSVQKSQK